ncbi:MAG: glycosyltransferase [Bacteroidales bacterium]|nr:glycosyltransferase [Bacteroidales bacterium]
MLLSVVIVNYNVKYFLKQCLASVFGSQRRLADGSELALDVWVVDNDSVDGSLDMVRSDFPAVHCIENHDNVGFARANNQALRAIASRNADAGEGASGSSMGSDADHLFLLLNPDTIVEADTFVKCADFMAQHDRCGGLCVKMVDGEGNYLPESKRGFPTPEASFFKISGLIHLFPHSRRIAAYYMGHLSEDDINEIEIMPGAFLMFRRAVYDLIGGLDESYFMYGEDIDFSWRIHQSGYSNYYLPTTHIIHYKGESTKKGSMNYVYTFYNAMAIFVKKYFTGRHAVLFNALLQSAIWLRAALAGVRRMASHVAVPLFDFAAAYGGFFLLKQLWSTLRGGDVDYYPAEYTAVVIPLYIIILLVGSWLSGGYDRPLRPSRIVRGMGAGLLMLLAFYSLLDEDQRYSRMLLLAGSLWTLLSTLLLRLVLSGLHVDGYSLRGNEKSKILILGGAGELRRVASLYASVGIGADRLVLRDLGHESRLEDIIRVEKIDEVVFCGSDIDLPTIISLMTRLRTTGVRYKIAPAEGDYVIGSNSIVSRDDLFTDDLVTITSASCRRQKRLFDLGSSLLLLIFSPLLVWLQSHPGDYLRHCFSVLVGRCSWVGYADHPGIFSPAALMPDAPAATVQRLTLRYMRRYRPGTDAVILLRNLRAL